MCHHFFPLTLAFSNKCVKKQCLYAFLVQTLLELWVVFSKSDFSLSRFRGTSQPLMKMCCILHLNSHSLCHWHMLTVLSYNALGYVHLLLLPNEEHPFFSPKFLVSVPQWMTLQFILAHFVPLVVEKYCCFSSIFWLLWGLGCFGLVFLN